MRQNKSSGRSPQRASAADNICTCAEKDDKTPWADGGGITGSWKDHAAAARSGFLAGVERANDGDVDIAMWAMQVAAEDDAIATHSVVELPVKPYLKRIDSMVTEFVNNHLPQDAEDNVIARAVESFLYQTKKYRLAEKQVICDSAVYSPYRIYLHNVLPQKCGTPTSLAVILIEIFNQLKAQGAMKSVPEVAYSQLGGVDSLPFAQDPEVPVTNNVVTCTPKAIMADMNQCLKKAYWPWEWVPGTTNGFLTAGEAAIGNDGRFGRNVANTFVPAKGRAFGDVRRALIATERLTLLLPEEPYEMRDYGTLLYHVGREQDAYQALLKYQSCPRAELQRTAAKLGIQPVGSDASNALREEEVFETLMEMLQREAVKSAFNAPSAPKEEK